MSSGIERLRAQLKAQRPGAWRDRHQTDDEARASLTWCRRMLYELEFLGDFELFAALRLGLRQRIEDLERRLGPADDIPF